MAEGTGWTLTGRMQDEGADTLPQRLRVAGYSTKVAVVTLVLSGIAIALFFGGIAYVFGPINDILVALTLVLLIPPVVAVRDLAAARTGGWFTALSILAIVGMLLAAVGQVLLVLGVINLQMSFMTGGIGILPLLVWIAALSALAVRGEVVSRRVGWWGAGFVGLSVFTAVAGGFLPMALLYAMGLPLLVAVAGWMLALANDLLEQARPAAAPS